jgi:DNA invertase Pin-like site-specific DNA recombinase
MKPCSVDGCPKGARYGEWCSAHWKRKHRGQPLTPSLQERPKTPLELLTESALAYAEAEGDQDFARALDNLRQSANRYTRRSAKGVSPAELRALHDELERVQAKLGRPRRLKPEEIAEVVGRVGSQAKAARHLRVSLSTVIRAIRWIKRTNAHTS